jgi:dUTP pyrophosphatase
MGETMKIPYRSDERAMEPVRASEGAAGWDLYTTEDIILKPYQAKIVPTGLKAAIPQGTVLFILPRSGFSLRNQIIMPNSVGVIDEDYRGGIGITMLWAPPLETVFETSVEEKSDDFIVSGGALYARKVQPFFIPKFTRIAQALLLPYFDQDWRKVDALPETERGERGFGHTGLGAVHAGPSDNKNEIS